MLLNNIVVMDYETGGANPHTCEPIQIAAIVLNPRTLEPYKDMAGEVIYFESLMRPLEPDKVESDALRINGKKMEDLVVAPLPEVVWGQFVNFVRQYTIRGKSSYANDPIAAGHNINGFDAIITHRMCVKYGPLRNKNQGDMRQGLFHNTYMYDTMQLVAMWFEGQKEPTGYGMDALRDFFGISKTGAHDALKDVKDTAQILSRFLGLHRKLSRQITFKGALAS